MPYTPAATTETNNVDNTFSNLLNLPMVRIFTEWTENGKGSQRKLLNRAFPGFFPDNNRQPPPTTPDKKNKLDKNKTKRI